MALVFGGRSVIFNGTEGQTANRAITHIGLYGGLQKDVTYLKVARANRSRKTNSAYPSRRIPFKGYVTGATLAALKTEVDNLNAWLEGVANLDIDMDTAGTYRRWKAEPQNVDLQERDDSPQRVDFTGEFVCVDDPFGYDTSATTLLNAVAITTASSTQAITLGGTASQQTPVIAITLTSISGAAVNTITITNTANGQSISISRVWTAGEVLTIDFSQQSCQVNGVEVDYSGPLAGMFWAKGAGNVKFDNDFTSRSLSVTMTNVNRYK